MIQEEIGEILNRLERSLIASVEWRVFLINDSDLVREIGLPQREEIRGRILVENSDVRAQYYYPPRYAPAEVIVCWKLLEPRSITVSREEYREILNRIEGYNIVRSIRA